MIETPTCFILGAGASVDARFPLGVDLRDQICRDLLGWCGASDARSSHPAYLSSAHHLLMQSKFLEHHIRKFSEALRRSGARSTDIFVANNREKLGEIGKAAIVAALIGYEDENELLYRKDPKPITELEEAGRSARIASDGWYDVLWEKMYRGASSPEEMLARNRVSFVTFNYDRSLEHFLAVRFAEFWQQPMSTRPLEKFPIVHVHGLLGPYLTGQDSVIVRAGRTYTPEAQIGDLGVLVEGIHIAHEELPDSTRDSIRQALERADDLFFLGFAYDPMNVVKLFGRLNPGKSVFNRIIAGQTRMHQADQIAAKKSLSEARLKPDPKMQPPERDCAEILRNYF